MINGIWGMVELRLREMLRIGLALVRILKWLLWIWTKDGGAVKG